MKHQFHLTLILLSLIVALCYAQKGSGSLPSPPPPPSSHLVPPLPDVVDYYIRVGASKSLKITYQAPPSSTLSLHMVEINDTLGVEEYVALPTWLEYKAVGDVHLFRFKPTMLDWGVYKMAFNLSNYDAFGSYEITWNFIVYCSGLENNQGFDLSEWGTGEPTMQGDAGAMYVCSCLVDYWGPFCEAAEEGMEAAGGVSWPLPVFGFAIVNVTVGTGDDEDPDPWNLGFYIEDLTSILQYPLPRPTIVGCYPKEVCLGLGKGCLWGHIGERCEECREEFYRPESMCVKCPDNDYTFLLIFLAVIFVATIVVVIVTVKYGVVIKRKTDELRHQFERHPQVILKITWGFMQTVGVLFLLDLQWPKEVASVFGFFRNAFTFGPNSLATDCSNSKFLASYGFKLGLRVFLPVIILVFVAIIFFLWKSAALCSSRMRKIHIADLPNALVTLYLAIHIILVAASLELFDCSEVPNFGYVLDAQPEIQCFTSEWFRLLPIGIFGMLIYGFLVPLALAYVFYSKRELLKSDEPPEEIVDKIGSLLVHYKPSHFYWELVFLTKQTCVASAALLFSSQGIVAASLVVVVLTIALLLHLYFRPYQHRLWNSLESLALVASIIIIILGIVTAAKGDEAKAQTVRGLSWSIVGLALFALSILVFFLSAYSLRALKNLLRNSKSDGGGHRRRIREKLRHMSAALGESTGGADADATASATATSSDRLSPRERPESFHRERKESTDSFKRERKESIRTRRTSERNAFQRHGSGESSTSSRSRRTSHRNAMLSPRLHQQQQQKQQQQQQQEAVVEDVAMMPINYVGANDDATPPPSAPSPTSSTLSLVDTSSSMDRIRQSLNK